MSWLGKLFGRPDEHAAKPTPPTDLDDPDEIIRAAWKCHHDGEHERALELLARVIDRDAEKADAWYTRGVIRCTIGSHARAIHDLDRAIALAPNHVAAMTERGLAYVESGSIERGIQDYDGALAIDPAHVNALDNKSSALCMLKRFDEALTLFGRVLRLAPRQANARFNRSVIHEQRGDLARARADLELYMAVAGSSAAPGAGARLAKLRATTDARAWDVTDELWTEYVECSLEDRVRDVLETIRARGAFHVVVPLAVGGRHAMEVFASEGLISRLTEVADLIGPPVLDLRLNQLLDGLDPTPTVAPTAAPEEVSAAVRAGGGRTLVVESEHVRGIVARNGRYARLRSLTVLFGPRTVFGRDGSAKLARRCGGCNTGLAYFHPKLDGDRVVALACPTCGRDPVPDWIERRMRPGQWSRCGFLDDHERLADVIERDAQTLAALGVTHAALGRALGDLLDRTSAASSTALQDAHVRLRSEMIAKGQMGLEGLGILDLEPSIDEVVTLLERGQLPPADQGTTIDGRQVFLRVFLGYQACPWTMLRLPFSADEPPWPMRLAEQEGQRFVEPTLGEALPCSRGIEARHGDRDFLIVDRASRTYLRGAGLLAHLIAEHRFFEGPSSPYRLDPERAVRVLGLA